MATDLEIMAEALANQLQMPLLRIGDRLFNLNHARAITALLNRGEVQIEWADGGPTETVRGKAGLILAAHLSAHGAPGILDLTHSLDNQ